MLRKITVLFAILCLATLVVAAGDKKASAADHAAKLKAELGLSDEQVAQAEAIIAEDMARMSEAKEAITAIKEELKALKADEEGNAEAIEAKVAEKKTVKEAYAAGRKAHHERLRAILTEEQATKFDEMMAAHSMDGKKREKH